MKLLKTSSVLCLVTLLAACSTTLEPPLSTKPLEGFDLVDVTRVDKDKYPVDYAECALLANQDALDVQRLAAGAVGAVADKATLGLIGSKTSKNADRATVLKRCLTGRGYNVLR
jgi:hypothetical protein